MLFSLGAMVVSIGSPTTIDGDRAGRTDPFLSRLRGENNIGMCAPIDLERGKPIPKTVLQQARDMPNKVRIVREGMAMIMDMRPNRLTITIDNEGLFVSARCG